MKEKVYPKLPLLRSLLDKSGIYTIENALELLKKNKIENNEEKISWDQPVINQKEIGYLGCITKEIKGVLYFLLQAKVEPGNINAAQFSPTLQATKSNFTRKHKGKTPKFYEEFINLEKSLILSDQLQSEHGSKFFNKRNRNIIIQINEIEFNPDTFIWLTLAQIKELSKIDNIINMDLKSVIGSLPLEFNQKDIKDIAKEYLLEKNSYGYKFLSSLISNSANNNSISHIQDWLSNFKFSTNIYTKFISLKNLKNWDFSNNGISHNADKFFSVDWIHAEIYGREVLNWDQPIIKVREIGLNCFFIKYQNGSYQFLVQAIREFGLIEKFEIGPTISVKLSNFSDPCKQIPFYSYFYKFSKKNFKFDAISSEEGGRFLNYQNRHVILNCEEDFNEEIPKEFMWVNYSDLMKLISYTNTVSIQARTLLSSINFCD